MKNPLYGALLSLLLLVGCGTTPVDSISQPPPNDPSLADVKARIGDFRIQRVRWGGTIVTVQNRPQDTEVEIVARALDDYGRPRFGGESLGRFIARIDGFLDPVVYARDRDITVAGTIEGKLTRAVGDYLYDYVVVRAEQQKLWEPRLPRPYYRDTYYDPLYDPFWPGRFGPWYPWYPWSPAYPYYPYWR